MSFTKQIQALTAALSDPKQRFEVARTLNFLKDAYSAGKMSDEQLLSDVKEVCEATIALASPDLTEDEVRERAATVAEEIVKSIKIECLFRRTLTRVRPTPLF
jgi:hypothetical protein